MNLELTLLGTPGYPSKDLTFIDRKRYKVQNDSEVLDSICKFIADHISDLMARINDNKFINRLETLKSLTIEEFSAIKLLMSFRGIDILAVYVSDSESNAEEIPMNSIEVNVLDRNNIIGSFVPFCTKITQLREEFKLSKVYKDILSMYGLFTGNTFDGVYNVVKANITSLESIEETKVTTVNAMTTTLLNSCFDAMNKERVIVRS